MSKSPARKRAEKLLRQYDEARRKLRELEAEVNRACLEYGDELRMSFLTPDKFRTILIVEEEQRANRKADEHQWERQHG